MYILVYRTQGNRLGPQFSQAINQTPTAKPGKALNGSVPNAEAPQEFICIAALCHSPQSLRCGSDTKCNLIKAMSLPLL